MNYKIGISGSYGGRNLGDEAILEGILQELGAHKNLDIVVFSFDPDDTKKRHRVRSVASRELHKDEIIEELKKLDLFILGGGGILFDGEAEKYLRTVIWAKELNIPVMIYAISVGPLNSAEAKQLIVKTLNKVDIITVRESESKRILHEIGVTKEIEVTGDPAFLIKPEDFTEEMLIEEGINHEIPLFGFSVREPGPAAPDLNIDHYHGMLANAADFMIERCEGEVVFVPLEQNRDSQHSHAIISKMLNTKHAKVLKKDYSSGQILGLVAHMNFAVGMRLHFLIFATLNQVPFIPLPYASKVKGLLEELEMTMPPIDAWNTGRLCAVLDRAWDHRRQLQKKLEDKLPGVMENARKTAEILLNFLKSLSAKT